MNYKDEEEQDVEITKVVSFIQQMKENVVQVNAGAHEDESPIQSLPQKQDVPIKTTDEHLPYSNYENIPNPVVYNQLTQQPIQQHPNHNNEIGVTEPIYNQLLNEKNQHLNNNQIM